MVVAHGLASPEPPPWARRIADARRLDLLDLLPDRLIRFRHEVRFPSLPAFGHEVRRIDQNISPSRESKDCKIGMTVVGSDDPLEPGCFHKDLAKLDADDIDRRIHLGIVAGGKGGRFTFSTHEK